MRAQREPLLPALRKRRAAPRVEMLRHERRGRDERGKDKEPMYDEPGRARDHADEPFLRAERLPLYAPRRADEPSEGRDYARAAAAAAWLFSARPERRELRAPALHARRAALYCASLALF